jgi:DNA-binding MarR family transcriptional regulator
MGVNWTNKKYLLVTSNNVMLNAMEKDLDTLEQAMSKLHRAMSRHRRWDNIVRQTGVDIDHTSAIILQVLASPKLKHCQLHEVAEKIGIEAPAVTRKTQLLEKAGLLRKHVDQKDGRAFTLELTPQGAAIAKRLRTAKRESLKSTLADWSSTDRQKLVELVEKFADSVITSNEQQKSIINK